MAAFFSLTLAAGWLSTAAVPAAAQLPAAQLHSIFPAGGRIGTISEVQVTGSDIDGADRLVFSHPHITAVQKTRPATPFETGPQGIVNQFTVAIHPDVPPGVYEARYAGRFGVSNPRAFIVSDLPEQKEPADNHSIAKAAPLVLNSVVSGTSDATNADFFKLKLTKDQRVVLDCWAERIDSRMDATLAISDMSGRDLAHDRDTHRGDPLLVFTAPADGEYIVKLYDFLYRGGSDYGYRLLVSTGPYIDSVFPPVALAGIKGTFTVLGSNLPGGTPAPGMLARGRQLEQITVEIEAPAGAATTDLPLSSLVRSADSTLDAFEYRLATPAGASNPLLISYAAAPVVLEQEPNDDPDKPQAITVPCEFVGRFAQRGDYDYLSFEAKKGDSYWFEAVSQRLGQATDPYVLIQRVSRNEKGEVQIADIQELDDSGNGGGSLSFRTTSDDPAYHFTAPEDGTYRVLIRDLYAGSRGDPRSVYALAIRRAAPDFRLVAVPVHHTNNRTLSVPLNPLLRRGGTDMLDVLALRRDGFMGEIAVTVEGLPPGVTALPAIIPAGQDGTTVVLRAAEDAPAWAGTISVVGRAELAGQPVARTARAAAVEWASAENLPAQSRLARDVWLSVLDLETFPFLVDFGEGKTWEMSRAGKLEIPIKILRRGDFKQAVALTPQSLPPNVKGEVTLPAPDASEGKLVLTIANNAPLGTFNPRLQANAAISYRRDPQTAEAAAAAQARITTVSAEATAASQAAEAAKQAADKLAADTTAAAKATADALAAETQKMAATADAAKAAVEKAAQSRAASEKEPGNTELAQAKEAADKVVVETQAVAQAAADAKAAADRAMAEAAARLQAATVDKAAKERAAAEIAAKAKAATDAKAAADKRAADTAKAAEAKNINVFESSTSTIVKITSAPMSLAVTAPPAAIKPGAQVEVPVVLNRLYGFADPVEVELVVPEQAKGVSAAKLPVAAGAAEGKLVVAVAADGAPGKHALITRAKFKFNGQDFTVDAPLAIEVEAAK